MTVKDTIMTDLTERAGFGSAIVEKTFAKRRRLGVELFATLALAVSLIIAATALHHGLTVVTRDVSDYQRARAPVLNPWLDTPPMRSSAESKAT